MASSHTRRSREASRDDAGEASAQTLADVERLMGQMREANEQLLVAAVHAQNQSDEAHAEAARTRADLEDLMNRLQDANQRLATAAARAQGMAEEAAARPRPARFHSAAPGCPGDEPRRGRGSAEDARRALTPRARRKPLPGRAVFARGPHIRVPPPPASIDLTATADAVALDIEDQGRGLRDQVPHQNGTLPPETLGVGIQGMRERIRQLGGTFDVAFTDTGTTVRVRVPLNEDVA